MYSWPFSWFPLWESWRLSKHYRHLICFVGCILVVSCRWLGVGPILDDDFPILGISLSVVACCRSYSRLPQVSVRLSMMLEHVWSSFPLVHSLTSFLMWLISDSCRVNHHLVRRSRHFFCFLASVPHFILPSGHQKWLAGQSPFLVRWFCGHVWWHHRV